MAFFVRAFCVVACFRTHLILWCLYFCRVLNCNVIRDQTSRLWGEWTVPKSDLYTGFQSDRFSRCFFFIGFENSGLRFRSRDGPWKKNLKSFVSKVVWVKTRNSKDTSKKVVICQLFLIRNRAHFIEHLVPFSHSPQLSMMVQIWLIWVTWTRRRSSCAVACVRLIARVKARDFYMITRARIRVIWGPCFSSLIFPPPMFSCSF